MDFPFHLLPCRIVALILCKAHRHMACPNKAGVMTPGNVRILCDCPDI
jgi:hypothetical protein